MNLKKLMLTAQHISLSLIISGFLALSANSDQQQSTNRAGLCDYPDELENTLATARQKLEDSKLLLACADGISTRSPSPYCLVSDPATELGFMIEELDDISGLILPAIIQAREAERNDPYPRYLLQKINGTVGKLDDFIHLPSNDLEGIERCSGGRLSYDCLTLVHACAGDFKCYGDGSCACYTCNQGSCGICPNGGVC